MLKCPTCESKKVKNHGNCNTEKQGNLQVMQGQVCIDVFVEKWKCKNNHIFYMPATECSHYTP